LSAFVVPSGAVKRAVVPVETVIALLPHAALSNSSEYDNAFVAAGSTNNAGHPVTPPLV
jgi:hypothetical protein